MRTIVTVTLTAALRKTLKENAELECRHLGKQAAFYLEVLSDAAKREQRLYRNMLLRWVPPSDPKLPNHDQLIVEDQAFDYLLDWAGSMGLTMSAFVRLALYNMAVWDRRLFKNRVAEKEDFTQKLLAAINADRRPTIH